MPQRTIRLMHEMQGLEQTVRERRPPTHTSRAENCRDIPKAAVGGRSVVDEVERSTPTTLHLSVTPKSRSYVVCPPSTFRMAPVTCRAEGLARKVTAAATSSGVPYRPSGLRLR